MTLAIPELQEQNTKWIIPFVLIIAFFGLGIQATKAQEKMQAEQKINQLQENIKTKASNDTIEYKGIVYYNNSNEPLPGVEIIVKGTKTVTISDINGEFTIRAKKRNVLIFKYISCEIKELKLKKKPTIIVNLDKIPTPGVVVITKYEEED